MLLNNLIQKRKYSLNKSLKIFFQVKDQLIRKRKKISASTYDELKMILLDLENAIQQKDHLKAYDLSHAALNASKVHLKKNTLDYFNEWVLGIGGILLLVSLVNQLWFQNYQIPSGSMRPTLLEKDRLIATKTNFGINLPFKKGHLFFNSKQLKRGNIVILQNDRLPKEENRSRYLFIFPAKKQFVKRLIGKPGDTLYFYGGKIYGVDRDGNEIADFHSSEAFENLEHIPFNSFEGKVITEPVAASGQVHSPVYLYQMDQLVGKLSLNASGSFQGKFYNGSQWVDESPLLSYQDLWGIRNYAMARLLSREDAQKVGAPSQNLDEPYILELMHSPHVNFPRPHLGMDLEGRLRPKLTLEKSYIPLNSEHLTRVKNALSSSRFVIKNGYGGNYSMERGFKQNPYSPYFEGIPDGTYEFINGTAYSVSSSGVQKELPLDHPLNSSDPKLVQRLFNLGMQMFTLYEPSLQHLDFIPPRYAYFREGDLYLMGKPILNSKDSSLIRFKEQEQQKSNSFIDHSPPVLKSGALDKDFILNYGLSIPKGQYLFLGDNHANSKDCRSWGFIPEENIQGAPMVMFWPFSKRLGTLGQNHLTWLNGPTILMTLLGTSLIVGSTILGRRQKKKQL